MEYNKKYVASCRKAVIMHFTIYNIAIAASPAAEENQWAASSYPRVLGTDGRFVICVHGLHLMSLRLYAF